MTSVAVQGWRYRMRPDDTDKLGPFDETYLAEGDSWMDASGALVLSLPYYLAKEFDKRGKSVLIINISTSGQTLQKIEDMMNEDFVWWLKQYRYKGILFSAGGNDFIDAAKEPPAGQGLLRDMAGQAQPADGYACVRQDALTTLVQGYLNPNFGAIYQALRASTKNRDTPMYLNSYETPVARDAPAIKNLVGPWLHAAYRTNSIASPLWPSLTSGLFSDIRSTIQGWTAGRTGLQVIGPTGLLTPANPASQGSSGDWLNEIHPNAAGWAKLAKVWADALA